MLPAMGDAAVPSAVTIFVGDNDALGEIDTEAEGDSAAAAPNPSPTPRG